MVRYGYSTGPSIVLVCSASRKYLALQRKPALLRTLPLLLLFPCVMRFHRRYSGHPALLNRYCRRECTRIPIQYLPRNELPGCPYCSCQDSLRVHIYMRSYVRTGTTIDVVGWLARVGGAERRKGGGLFSLYCLSKQTFHVLIASLFFLFFCFFSGILYLNRAGSPPPPKTISDKILATALLADQ